MEPSLSFSPLCGCSWQTWPTLTFWAPLQVSLVLPPLRGTRPADLMAASAADGIWPTTLGTAIGLDWSDLLMATTKYAATPMSRSSTITIPAHISPLRRSSW